MSLMAVWLKVDEERVVQALQEAGEKLDTAEGELMLDFSSVLRIDVSGLMALERSPAELTTKALRSHCVALTSASTKCSSW